ncbi:hypothetical protein OA5_05985 [Vibrio cyclitrophicus 1F111]|uniref:glycosyltransferase n=1 Tax=Vibrio cyclitrophicus TaxID=47951 RepID=UPI000305CB3B|nr:glycosyltransferase [Vibrio cyclitrophicus]OEF75424.1 hypothetical protein OA5_05985 [Vibrio cyclitrophicus 1F111]
MRVIALVTLFYPDYSNKKNIEELSLQVDRVVLLDNTPNIDNTDLFSDIDVEYIPNSENLGLSAAFNIGINHVKKIRSDFVVFFDQDSRVSKGLIDQLVHDFKELSKTFKVGCIGPVYYDENSNKIVENRDAIFLEDKLFSVKSVITSSLLTSYQVLEDIGGWNESIFLDYADWDLCWRMKERGYILALDTKVTLSHSLGDSSVSFGGLSFPKYSPVREYYRIRDSLKLFTEEYVPTKYKVKFVYTWLIEPFIYLALFPQRLLRIKFVLRAFKDAFRKVDGAI